MQTHFLELSKYAGNIHCGIKNGPVINNNSTPPNIFTVFLELTELFVEQILQAIFTHAFKGIPHIQILRICIIQINALPT
jgi:hypothetical protein